MFEDWTFESNLIVTLDTDPAHRAPQGSSPVLQLSGSGSDKLVYPHSSIVNGISNLGFNSGQIENWVNYVTMTTSQASNRLGYFFRSTNYDLLNGYKLSAYGSRNSAGASMGIEKWVAGVGVVGSSWNTTQVLANNTWYKQRLSWYETSNGYLTIKFEMSFDNGVSYVEQNGAGYIDTSPSFASTTNKVFMTYDANAQSIRMDQFQLHPRLDMVI